MLYPLLPTPPAVTCIQACYTALFRTPAHQRPLALPFALASLADAGTSSAAVGAAALRPASAVAASDGRHSPPPVGAEELAAGELEVVHEEEDARMLELLRAQVGACGSIIHVAMTHW